MMALTDRNHADIFCNCDAWRFTPQHPANPCHPGACHRDPSLGWVDPGEGWFPRTSRGMTPGAV